MTPGRALHAAFLLVLMGAVGITRPVAAEEYRSGRVFYRAIVIKDSQFSSALIRQYAERFTREVANRYAIAWLDIETSSSVRAYQGPMPESGTPEYIRHEQERLSKIGLNTARVFIRYGRAALQTRYQSGLVEQTVRGNYDDPLKFRIGSLDLRLVLPGVKRCSPLNRSLPPDSAFSCNADTLDLHFRSPRLLSRVEAAELWKHVRNEVGTDSLSLTIRRVAWCGQMPILSAPPFEDAVFTQCRSWKDEPDATLMRSGAGAVSYILLDGETNASTPLTLK